MFTIYFITWAPAGHVHHVPRHFSVSAEDCLPEIHRRLGLLLPLDPLRRLLDRSLLGADANESAKKDGKGEEKAED